MPRRPRSLAPFKFPAGSDETSRMHVLLVVDDKLAKAAKIALESETRQIAIAPTPSQALALAKRRAPDCVVLKELKNEEELQTFRQSLASRCPGPPITVVTIKPEDTVETIVREVEAAESARNDGAAALKPAELTVLLLDDRGIARKHMAAAVAAEGWRVLEAADSREATLKLLDEKIDCFLLTSMLAGQSSAGVIKSAIILREVHPYPFGIVVLVDAEEGQGAANTMKTGADDVIAKSSSAQVLARRMQSAVQLRDLRRENRRLQGRLDALEQGESPKTPDATLAEGSPSA